MVEICVVKNIKEDFPLKSGSLENLNINEIFFRFSDLYMSRVTNLNRYSLQHCFYPRRGALPHEFKSWFVWLINFSSDHGFHVNYVRTLKNIRFSYVVYINVVCQNRKYKRIHSLWMYLHLYSFEIREEEISTNTIRVEVATRQLCGPELRRLNPSFYHD